jgi:peroxiredoxin (alkyl hydroperoxide reductase subunit C)
MRRWRREPSSAGEHIDFSDRGVRNNDFDPLQRRMPFRRCGSDRLGAPPFLPGLYRNLAFVKSGPCRRSDMLGIGDKLPSFSVTGVKPGFNAHQENGESAFETLTEASFPGKWKVIFFYPKDFTFVCPTEIAEFARLAGEFEDRDAVVMGGSTDNEFVKLAWRRDHRDLDRLPIWQFGDTNGSLVDGLGVRSPDGVAYRTTFIVDPDGTIQHVYATNLNVGRNPKDTLRVLDALQTDELCPCNREVGGDVLKAA